MAGRAEFNSGKFKELVLYLSAASADDEGFGMVKLNKLLYRADFEAYRLLGHPITGETYQKQEYGPVASHLPIALDELASEGRLRWQLLPSGPYTRKVPTASEDSEAGADESVFSEAERGIIEKTIRELAAYGAKDVSEWSHETSVGWQVVELREEIPYSMALVSAELPEPEVLAALREFDSAP